MWEEVRGDVRGGCGRVYGVSVLGCGGRYGERCGEV